MVHCVFCEISAIEVVLKWQGFIDCLCFLAVASEYLNCGYGGGPAPALVAPAAAMEQPPPANMDDKNL
jgi:hypothetical protein